MVTVSPSIVVVSVVSASVVAVASVVLVVVVVNLDLPRKLGLLLLRGDLKTEALLVFLALGLLTAAATELGFWLVLLLAAKSRPFLGLLTAALFFNESSRAFSCLSFAAILLSNLLRKLPLFLWAAKRSDLTLGFLLVVLTTVVCSVVAVVAGCSVVVEMGEVEVIPELVVVTSLSYSLYPTVERPIRVRGLAVAPACGWPVKVKVAGLADPPKNDCC